MILFSWLSFGGEVDCSRNPCHQKCLPPGVRLRCIPVFSTTEKPRNPMVEGQRIVYLNSTDFPYDQVQTPMTSFLRDWAKSCPGDRRNAEPSGRPNNITVQSYPRNSEQVITDFSKAISAVRPQSVIVQYTSQGSHFEKAHWSRFLDRIPKTVGCLIFAPFQKQQTPKINAELRQLQDLLIAKQHSCQLVDAKEELLANAPLCESPARSLASKKQCQVQNWIQQMQLQACNLDPRTFTDPGATSEAPSGPTIGN